MPKIKITEIDNTGVVNEQALSNTVYIPGAYNKEAVEPILYTTKKQLQSASDLYDTETLSFRLALHLLEIGMYVLYEGVEVTNKVPQIDWNRIADKSLYDVRFLTTGGYACPSKAMVNCAAKRGDCIALLDHPKDETTPSTEPDAVVNAVRTFFETNCKITSSDTDYYLRDVDSNSFASAFTPWFVSDNDTLRGVEDDVDVPASFGYLFSYADAIRNNPEWFAMAGSFRGIIKELVDVLYTYSSSEVEILQARAKTGEVDLDGEGDNVGCAINPISMVRPFGFIVWGNRTFRENTEEKGTIATSFLNVRSLVCSVKKSLYNAARKYTFEQNSDLLWINFQAQITPLLDKMTSGNGILGYRFTKLKTDKKARLKARLTIIPIEAVEDFELEVELADSLELTE